ncbi:MAG: alpha/beta fold hydrolase [Cyanobacteria bacterium J06628_4]
MIETWSHGKITTNGIQLHYVTQGEGPLMLLLHGFPEFWYSWRHQIPEFARDHTVVALDLRGYNDSDRPQSRSAYHMDELVADVKGAIASLGYDRCILVGHDWGGAIAWQFVYRYPAQVDRLIILNLPHPAKFAQGLRTWQQLARSWYILFFQLPLLPELLLQANLSRSMEQTFRGMAIDKSAFSDADIKAYTTALAKPGALTAALNYYRNLLPLLLSPTDWPILFQTRTLMIWGENDVALGKELTEGTEDYVQDFQIRYIPNCSHWVQQEQPQLVNHYIRTFLAE